MQRNADVSLAKYHLAFFGAYLGAGVLLALTQLMGLHLWTWLRMLIGLAVVPAAAYVALQFFFSDHRRGFAPDESRQMVRAAMWVLGGLLVIITMVFKSKYDHSYHGIIRPLPFWFMPLVAIVAIGLLRLQLWLVYGVLNNSYPQPGAAAGAGPARVVARVRTLVLGSGAAAHAVAWKLGQSPRVLEVLVAPGNAGTAATMRCRNIVIDANDVDALVALVRREAVQLVVVTDANTALVSRLHALDVPVVGPNDAALALAADPAALAAFANRHALAFADVGDAGTDVELVAISDGSMGVLVTTVQAIPVAGSEPNLASPAPALSTMGQTRAVREMLTPVVQGLVRDNAAYTGFLQVRVRVAVDGTPRLVGLVAGLDDATTPAWILRLQADLFELAHAATECALDAAPVRINPRTAVAQTLGARAEAIGHRVEGLDARPPLGTHVFHGATRTQPIGTVVAGPHVLSVVSLGDTVPEAARANGETAGGLSWQAVAVPVAATA
jgi:phosphoribosylamine--glycine ligase